MQFAKAATHEQSWTSKQRFNRHNSGIPRQSQGLRSSQLGLSRYPSLTQLYPAKLWHSASIIEVCLLSQLPSSNPRLILVSNEGISHSTNHHTHRISQTPIPHHPSPTSSHHLPSKISHQQFLQSTFSVQQYSILFTSTISRHLATTVIPQPRSKSDVRRGANSS